MSGHFVALTAGLLLAVSIAVAAASRRARHSGTAVTLAVLGAVIAAAVMALSLLSAWSGAR